MIEVMDIKSKTPVNPTVSPCEAKGKEKKAGLFRYIETTRHTDDCRGAKLERDVSSGGTESFSDNVARPAQFVIREGDSNEAEGRENKILMVH